jgi:hypothetical protein
MSLINWFRKSIPSSPQLDALVHKVVFYLKSRPSDDQIVPKIVGKAIGETEIRAFTALRVLEQRGVVHQHFGMYCGRTEVPLKSVDDMAKLPATVYCETCGEDHSGVDDEYKVEVYYTIDPVKLAQFSERLAAA